MKLSKIHINPDNPRIIKDDRFKKLVKSIKEFPKMMKLRPIIVDAEGMILGGNMRFKALKELGYKEVPAEWIKYDGELTNEENSVLLQLIMCHLAIGTSIYLQMSGIRINLLNGAWSYQKTSG